MDTKLLGMLVGELGKLGIAIFQSIQAGTMDEWTPVIEKLSPEVQTKLYHLMRMEQLGEKLDEILPEQ